MKEYEGIYYDESRVLKNPIFGNKPIWHNKDIEYFTDFPAPIMELIHSSHFTNINSTIAFFGPMLYFLIRAIIANKVLEIGVAQGYTSWYLANAVKDNAIRYQFKDNMYYGIDIIDCENIKKFFNFNNLPHTILQMDSMDITSETFKDIEFDLIFQDGCHDSGHIIHECQVLYPQLKGEGKGFWIAHDVYGPGYNGINTIVNDSRYKWEYVRIPEIYGIAILRKMDNYIEKNTWI